MYNYNTFKDSFYKNNDNNNNIYINKLKHTINTGYKLPNHVYKTSMSNTILDTNSVITFKKSLFSITHLSFFFKKDFNMNISYNYYSFFYKNFF